MSDQQRGQRRAVRPPAPPTPVTHLPSTPPPAPVQTIRLEAPIVSVQYADEMKRITDALEAAEKALKAANQRIAWLEHMAETERVRYADAQQGYLASIREGLLREQHLRDRISDLTNPGWRTPEPIKGDM